MTAKRLSIVLPTRNPGPALEETVQSVLAQRDEAVELIVVDAASTDGTIATLKGYGEQLRWVSERDGGVYEAMNKGIALAAGEYLYFLGAGDRLRRAVLRRLLPALPAGRPTLVYANVYLVNEQRTSRGEVDAETVMRRNVCHQAVIYQREIFSLCGPYDTRYRLLADQALNVRCFTDPRIDKLFVDETIADYAGGGISQQLGLDLLRDHWRMAREVLGVRRYLGGMLRNARERLTGAPRRLTAP